MTLIDWRPCRRGSLRGFATVELTIGLQMADVTVHLWSGRAWARPPGRPVIDTTTGAVLRDDRGRIRYASLLSWRSRDLNDRWSDAVVALVRAEHPGDLAEDVITNTATRSSERTAKHIDTLAGARL